MHMSAYRFSRACTARMSRLRSSSMLSVRQLENHFCLCFLRLSRTVSRQNWARRSASSSCGFLQAAACSSMMRMMASASSKLFTGVAPPCDHMRRMGVVMR